MVTRRSLSSECSHPPFLSRRLFGRQILGIGLAVLGLAGCSSLPKSRYPAHDVSADALDVINAFRTENGLQPLKIDAGLVELAKDQAGLMADKQILSHDVDGDFESRMNKGGYRKQAGAENVGAGHADVAATLAAWQRSPGHRANLLMPEAIRFGMAKADAPEARFRNYWALILAGK
jgi:uncharacterized protein YkwD